MLTLVLSEYKKKGLRDRQSYLCCKWCLIVAAGSNSDTCASVSGIVHRDLKLENILMGENKDDPSDKLHIKVRGWEGRGGEETQGVVDRLILFAIKEICTLLPLSWIIGQKKESFKKQNKKK